MHSGVNSMCAGFCPSNYCCAAACRPCATFSFCLACVLQEEELLIKPAVQGTENVLASVNATSSVERVIVTSSTAAVCTDGTERGKGHMFTEADWNLIATPTKFPYFYSKKMAELVSRAKEEMQIML